MCSVLNIIRLCLLQKLVFGRIFSKDFKNIGNLYMNCLKKAIGVQRYIGRKTLHAVCFSAYKCMLY